MPFRKLERSRSPSLSYLNHLQPSLEATALELTEQVLNLRLQMDRAEAVCILLAISAAGTRQAACQAVALRWPTRISPAEPEKQRGSVTLRHLIEYFATELKLRWLDMPLQKTCQGDQLEYKLDLLALVPSVQKAADWVVRVYLELWLSEWGEPTWM